MAWQFWVDRGGTFTDIIGVDPDGQLVCRKYLSHQPERYRDAAAYGIRQILGVASEAPFPAATIQSIKVGTTVATNALLERAGAPTALAITRGFADALLIGTQHRPRLFDLNIVRPAPIYRAVIEIAERVSATGEVLAPLDDVAVRNDLQRARANGCEAVAIVLMHGYRFQAHEQRVAALAREIGFPQISISHAVNPMIKLVPRADTTVCDAYLSPVLDRYVGELNSAVGGAQLYFMQSNGGVAAADRFRGKDAVLSGPAGGVVGCVETSRAAGYDKIIGFDMGGTSTDVSHYAGAYERTFETAIDGVRLRAPMMKLHTVAAGGGSICVFDGLRFRVGPESAGADPGPACYGRGGPLTVTDCNVLLGRIRPDRFPRVFGPDGAQPIDPHAARRRVLELAGHATASTGRAWSAEELAEGFLEIAVDNVARAIRKVSVEAGHDVRDYVLSCFGGAGGQLACRVAESLGMSTVMLHPLAGVLSAYGIGLARPTVIKEQTLGLPLGQDTLQQLQVALDRLASKAKEELPGASQYEMRVHLRTRDTEASLAVPFASFDVMQDRFGELHTRRFGFAPSTGQLICETIEVEARLDGAPLSVVMPREAEADDGETSVAAWWRGQHLATRCLARCRLTPGAIVQGPAIVTEALATTVIEPGWQAERRAGGELILSRVGGGVTAKPSAIRDPVTLELFNNLFMSIAEQMGAILQSTARSVNIRERLDFSCAVFDSEGNLIANAPHMPVHLGSMGDSVRAVRDARRADLLPGSVFAVNAPYAGGTHLPDITVVTPVFGPGAQRPDFFVASRGHHADVGGMTPGSMPPRSRLIGEEGVLFDSLQIVADGVFHDTQVRAVLASGAYPSRDPDTNVADLKAQCAANAAGADELLRACMTYGSHVVVAYMGHVQDYAEEAVRRAITRLTSGAFQCPMDNGAAVAVRIDIDHTKRTATIDFTGTSPQTADNFNAPIAVCRAAVLYVFRTMVDEDIPLNDGCLRPLKLVIPPGSILDPRPPAAVVAGNVETSQIVCDALFGALGAVAAAQGTMNNFTFGNARHQYYETICGGAGAGPAFDGADAVQTHMTNSRLTDPEILESRFPVMLEDFRIRHRSGGRGRHSGGDGVHRTLRFLEPMTAAILSGRRATAPFGLDGGGDGAPGRTTITDHTGRIRELAATAEVEMAAGDRMTIETPGGGGYGPMDNA